MGLFFAPFPFAHEPYRDVEIAGEHRPFALVIDDNRPIATIEDALRSMADLPASVQTWDVEIGADATGDEAVWVWVTLQEEDLNRQTREQFRSLARNAVRQQTSNSPLWVCVRFRGASEAVTFGQVPGAFKRLRLCP